MSIKSFKGYLTEKIFYGTKDKEVAKFPSTVLPAARRKLDMMEAAVVLQDLATPPGNKLHALKDNLAGYHSIHINDQWVIVFKWETDGPHEVEIQDYH